MVEAAIMAISASVQGSRAACAANPVRFFSDIRLKVLIVVTGKYGSAPSGRYLSEAWSYLDSYSVTKG